MRLNAINSLMVYRKTDQPLLFLISSKVIFHADQTTMALLQKQTDIDIDIFKSINKQISIL